MTSRSHRTLPRLPSALVVPERARKQLDRWAAVTIVRGAQGYGKTTLVAGWLRDQPDTVRSVWVSARPGDQRTSMSTRLLHQMARCGLLADSLHPAPPGGHGGLGLVALLHRIIRPPGVERIVVVIDDAQWLKDVALLARLVDVVAHQDHLHLILCSRSRHPIESLAPGVVELVAVPARDLLLNVDEIRALADSLGVPISTERAKQLHGAIAGWVGALRLVLEEITRPDQDLPLTKALDYLNDTVLPSIGDGEILGHVLRFAVAERLSYRLIRDLADHPEPDAVVRMVEAPGFAQRYYEADDIVLVLPSFIRAGLRDWFAARNPEQAREMHRRLARWYAEHDGPAHSAHALHHAIAGADWAQMDRIWHRRATELLLEHAPQLAQVLDVVPEAELVTRPGMWVARETARAMAVPDSNDDGRMVVVRTYVETSRRLASRGLDHLSLHDLYYVGTGYHIALRAEGKFAEANDVADRIERLADARTAAGADPGDRIPWFQLQRGITHTLRADHAAAIHRYRLAWQQRRDTTRHVAANASANLALSYALTGNLPEAKAWLGRHQRVSRGGSWGSHLLDSGARIATAWLALDRLDPGACLTELNLLGDGSAPLELWPFVARLQARFRLHYADPATALGVLDEAQQAHPADVARGEAAVLMLTAARAELLLAEGQGQRALDLLSRHRAESVPILAVPLVRLHLLAGDPVEACRIAAALLWSDTTDNRSRQELLLLKALAAHRMGDPLTSSEMTRRALALYQHTRLLLPFATFAPEDLSTLFETAGRRLPGEDADMVAAHRSPFRRAVTLIQLTPRERLLGRALATTASRQEIAADLFVSVNTVRAQLATLYRKLGVRSRSEALAKLAQLGLTSE